MNNQPNFTKCKTCNAEVFWVTTEKGKQMPIDAKPNPDGLFIASQRGSKLFARHVSSATPDELVGRNRYTSHFERCPQAAEHRRAR